MKDAALRTALAGLAALAVAMGIGRFAFTPILPMMQAEGAIDLVRGGWLASANYAGYLAGGLTALAWRWSAQSAIRAGLAAVALTTLGMALPLGITAWLALRAASGVASAWVLVFTSSAVLERVHASAPGARATLPGILYAGVGVGIVAAGLVCAATAHLPHASQASWLVTGLAAAAVTAVPWNAFGSARGARAGAATTPRSIPASGWALAACYAAFGFGYIIPATFLSAMARDAAGGGVVYVLTWPLFGLAAASSTWAVSRGTRWPARSVWALSHAVMAAGVALAALSSALAAVIACGLLVGGTFMVATMAGMQEARAHGGAAAARMMALMTSAFAAGQIAGPLVVSALAAAGRGYAAGLWIAAAALALTAALLPFIPRSTTP
jgi:hypothetical protein